jgi:hypothetical protein
MTRSEIIAAWNAQADDSNSWHHLGEDEKLEWAIKLEREACAKVCEPSEEHRRDASWGYIGGEEGVELLDAKAAAIRERGNT